MFGILKPHIYYAVIVELSLIYERLLIMLSDCYTLYAFLLKGSIPNTARTHGLAVTSRSA